jgi:hypothetical protein
MKPKAKPSLVDDAKALQGTWDMPPKKGSDGKLTHGLRLEIRDGQMTVLVYAKAGAPRDGDHLMIERPFTLKDATGKRVIHNEGEDVSAFTYELDKECLTITSEDFITTKIGKEWNVPSKNLLKKLPDKK